MAPKQSWKAPSADKLLHAFRMKNITTAGLKSLNTSGFGLSLPVLEYVCENLHLEPTRKVKLWLRRRWHTDWCCVRSSVQESAGYDDSTVAEVVDHDISIDFSLDTDTWTKIKPILRGNNPRLKMQVGWPSAFCTALQHNDALCRSSLIGLFNDK